MPQLISNMYMLMFTALFIGFIIGWFIRRRATRNKYEAQLDDLVLHDDHMTTGLHENSKNHENKIRELTDTKEKIDLTKKHIENHSQKKQNLVNDIAKFNLSQKTIKEDLLKIDDKIKNVKNELDVLNSQKDEIKQDKNEILKYEEKISKKNEELNTLREKISQLTADRESLNAKVANQNDYISHKEKEIDVENSKIKVIENEFANKRSDIMDELESTRRKALNYQYAVNYVNEKIEAKEMISFDTIDKIISKNEETGIFTNLMKKLFSKSAKYITGGK